EPGRSSTGLRQKGAGDRAPTKDRATRRAAGRDAPATGPAISAAETGGTSANPGKGAESKVAFKAESASASLRQAKSPRPGAMKTGLPRKCSVGTGHRMW